MIKTPLDDFVLAEHEVWQRENFNRQVERVKTILDGIERDIDQAIEWINYDGDMGRNHSDAAAQITAALVQAFANCDLRGLNDAAADLTVTLMMRKALADLRVEHPSIHEKLTSVAIVREQARAEKAERERLAREKREAERCQAAVGSGQCSKKATGTALYDVDGATYRVCGTHRKRFTPYAERFKRSYR